MSNEIKLEFILQAVKSCLPPDLQFVGLHEPYFGGREWDYVKECLDTGWVSSVGKFVDKFEEKLAEFTGVDYAVAVVNGTSAIHICLILAGVEQGDEVLVPALTFVATANAVTYCGAIPHFVESEEKTLGLDPLKLADYLDEIGLVKKSGCFNKKTGRRIRAVLSMHTFGHPVDLDPLVETCRKFKLELIEDAAEALGSYYKGRHVGNWGRLSALSFNGNKIITTGGGGAILTNDSALAKLAKHLTTTAKVPHKWEFYHDMTGYNYRLPNINAALGCAQLEQIPEFLEKKRSLADRYRVAFSNAQGVKFYTEPEFAKSNYWLNVLLMEKEDYNIRDAILELTNANNFMTRPAWKLLHKLPMYESCPRMDLSVAESLESRLINLPSSVFLYK